MIISCRQAESPPFSTAQLPTTLTIGVPEGDVNAPDVGIRQLAQGYSYEGLTIHNLDGRSLPRLAERWSTSGDGLTWTFRLRDPVRFHDQTMLDASRVADSLNASLARREALSLRPALLDVLRVEPRGRREIVFQLRRRSAFLLDELDMAIGSTGQPGPKSVGTGPFQIERSSSSEIVMAAHREYYLGPPTTERVVIRSYPTLRTAWASLMRGEIDVVSDVAFDAIDFVSSDQIGIHSFLRSYVYLIAFNSKRPQFRSGPVRRALNAAIDRDALIRSVLKGHGVPASGPLWPQHWAFDRTVPGYSFDPGLAASSLDASGLKLAPPADDGGVPSRLRFSCLVPQNFSTLERIALTVQKHFYDVGVDMQLEAVSAEEFNKRVRAEDFDAMVVDMISGPTFARPYLFWRSPGELKGLNVFGYRNVEADRWFDALRSASDDATVRAAASQLQRVMLQDPPALFLAWNERARAISRKFRFPLEPGKDPLASSSLRLFTLESAARLMND